MTDKELRDAAVAELKQTTVGYINKHWTNPPVGTRWANALDLLSKIGVVVPPPIPPPLNDYPTRPVLNNPIIYHPTNTGGRVINPGGKDYIIVAPPYPLEQIPTANSNNAILNIRGGGNGYIEGPLRIKMNIKQGTNGYGNGFGYGIYFTDNIGRFWADDVQIAGPGCAQGVVFFNNLSNANPIAQFMRLHIEAMHPVWHKAKGAPAEVHSDAMQSYGGPYSLQLFDTTLVTCGTALQMTVRQHGIPPIGSWITHRMNCRYVANPLSDERPYILAKYGGGVKWPWEQKDVWTHAGNYTSDNWATNSIKGWNPGGSYPVTGEAWHIGQRNEGDYVPLDPVLM